MQNHSPIDVQLSIVIVPVVGKEALIGCLDAIGIQSLSPDEIFVPYDQRKPEIAALEAVFPQVTFIMVPGSKTFAELRAEAVGRCRGHFIAITEDHCQPESDWCANIVKSHTRSNAVIGGVVEKKPPDKLLNWAVYFADYVRYARPVEEGSAASLTDLNVTYKREALGTISDVWQEEFHENAVHTAFIDAGHALWLSPGIVVYQRRNFDLGSALKDRYEFGRLYASTRIKWLSAIKRLVFALSAILIPFLLTIRVSLKVFRKQRWIKEFILALPALFLINTMWAAGEFTGYLTGKSGDILSPTTVRSETSG